MNPTRRTRALAAGPRRGLASVWTALFVVLTFIGTSGLCSGFLDEAFLGEHLHGGQPVHSVLVGAPAGDGAHDCSDRHPPAAQCAPLPPVTSPGPAAAPEPAVRQPALIPVPDDAPAPANTAEATRPSLHALGISRT
ncbi:hypothetical protein AB1046_08845 [Promicromonospora sp. Populi]|uniref:hypothetical protein n=1 Tax=Promicromonospora sp. Populi TaxID=3239420 RepID=UPI0034E2F183